ncbi:hypothetical protein R0J93_25720, partial [Pseudoalteromonas sp. SIMBA_148]
CLELIHLLLTIVNFAICIMRAESNLVTICARYVFQSSFGFKIDFRRFDDYITYTETCVLSVVFGVLF